MADIELVIKIPEEDFERCKKKFQMRLNIMAYAIAKGTPLDDIFDRITATIEKYKDDCGKPEDIGYFSEVNQSTIGAYEACLRIIDYWRNEVSE